MQFIVRTEADACTLMNLLGGMMRHPDVPCTTAFGFFSCAVCALRVAVCLLRVFIFVNKIKPPPPAACGFPPAVLDRDMFPSTSRLGLYNSPQRYCWCSCIGCFADIALGAMSTGLPTIEEDDGSSSSSSDDARRKDARRKRARRSGRCNPDARPSKTSSDSEDDPPTKPDKRNGEGKGNNRGRGKDKDPATTATRRPSARGGRTGKEPSTTSKGHQRTTTGGMYKTLWDLHNAGDWIRAGHAPPHAALRNTVDEVPDDPDWVGA